jgi:tetratricopeptide (TPR) repeat protein
MGDSKNGRFVAALPAALLAALALAPAAPAQTVPGADQIVVEGQRESHVDWKRAESRHVIIFSDGSEAELRKTATDIEQLHRLLARLYGPVGETESAAKPQIFLVDSTATYRGMALRHVRSDEGPYVRSFAEQRYYDPRDDGAVIVVPRSDQIIDLDTSRARDADCQDIEFELLMAGKTCGDVVMRPTPVARPWESVLFSAYAQHFILSEVPAGYPRWYLDGVGALFSTAKIGRDGSLDYAKLSLVNAQIFRSYGRLNIGDVLTGRYLAAPNRRMEWTPFHAALLVHFFVYGDIKAERRTQFQRYMTAIHQGVPMAEAAQVFGDMRKLQFEIAAYIVRRSRSYARTQPGGMPVETPTITILSPASAAIVEASLELDARLPAGGDAADTESLLRQVRTAAGKFPQDVDASLMLARAECTNGRYGACLEAAEQALGKAPEDVAALSWKGLAQANEALAKPGKARSADLEAARATIGRAIALDGDAPLPRIAYFQSFAIAGEAVPADAMAGMAKVVRLVPAAPGPRLALGKELIRQGQPDLARKLLSPVLFGPYDSPERKAAAELFALPGEVPRTDGDAAAAARPG